MVPENLIEVDGVEVSALSAGHLECRQKIRDLGSMRELAAAGRARLRCPVDRGSPKTVFAGQQIGAGVSDAVEHGGGAGAGAVIFELRLGTREIARVEQGLEAPQDLLLAGARVQDGEQGYDVRRACEAQPRDDAHDCLVALGELKPWNGLRPPLEARQPRGWQLHHRNCTSRSAPIVVWVVLRRRFRRLFAGIGFFRRSVTITANDAQVRTAGLLLSFGW